MEFHLSLILVLLVILVVQSPCRVCSKSIVRYLPGFDGALPFQLETGYVSIDDPDGAELFYYFFKSENNPASDPILFWFTGGPGCSGLGALAFENGPLWFNYEKYNGTLPTLTLNPYSWTKMSNIVFLDAPPGTGFSYARSLKTSITDEKSSKQGYIFIKKWFIDHPEFLSNPLYLSGDSYSGQTIPRIGQYISNDIENGDVLLVNFKGYLLGNPVTDLHMEKNSKIPYAHNMALISTELFESVKKNCGGEYSNVDPKNTQCQKDLQRVSECTRGINDAHILEPRCFLLSPKLSKEIKKRSSLEMTSPKTLLFPFGVPNFGCRSYGYMLSYYWANDEEVQNALHIRKGFVPEWNRCNQEALNYFYENISSVGYHTNLSRQGYRSLIYSGDHDNLVPHLSTESWIKSLNYSIVDDWRPWFVGGQVAGYTRTYANNMTFATIKGGGHTAPEYKPYECFSMLKKWLSFESL